MQYMGSFGQNSNLGVILRYIDSVCGHIVSLLLMCKNSHVMMMSPMPSDVTLKVLLSKANMSRTTDKIQLRIHWNMLYVKTCKMSWWQHHVVLYKFVLRFFQEIYGTKWGILEIPFFKSRCMSLTYALTWLICVTSSWPLQNCCF